MRTWRRIAIGAFFAFQIAMIGWAFVSPYRFYSWAPHDAQGEYAISARLNGRALGAGEIEARYRIRAEGVDPRAVAHVLLLVEKAEARRPRRERAEVTVRYRLNGGAWQTWSP